MRGIRWSWIRLRNRECVSAVHTLTARSLFSFPHFVLTYCFGASAREGMPGYVSAGLLLARGHRLHTHIYSMKMVAGYQGS